MRPTSMPTRPRRRVPVWDATRSEISQPVLLYEGDSCRFVDYNDVSDSHSAGKEIVVRWLKPQTVITIDWLNPQSPIQRNLGTVRRKRTVKVAERISEPPNLCGGGISCRLPAGKRDNGFITAFAAGHKRTRTIINARKTVRWRPHNNGVPRAVFMATPERAILYFPGEGALTSQSAKDLRVVRKTENGWEVFDGPGLLPTLITETEAREMVESGEAVIGRGSGF